MIKSLFRQLNGGFSFGVLYIKGRIIDMPELPEVQTVVSDLQKILPGKKIALVNHNNSLVKNLSFSLKSKEVFVKGKELKSKKHKDP